MVYFQYTLAVQCGHQQVSSKSMIFERLKSLEPQIHTDQTNCELVLSATVTYLVNKKYHWQKDGSR